ncbi:heparinase II/III family protein [Pseudofrankia sp. DC12]|uniref:heparinase II/III family protein n=1 Tax=Pseudofrankia sp. DC12 TaxID=683315 RepID=UPI0005F7957D|nr:heparinase II/III family protein [Pseudofrankia sp. DC12]
MIPPPWQGRHEWIARGSRPGQLVARARLRGQRAALAHVPGLFTVLTGAERALGADGWPAGFVPLAGRCRPLWADPARLAAGQLTLLGHTRTLHPAGPEGAPDTDWAQPDAAARWHDHLHGWEWAWALTTDGYRDLFGGLYLSWRAACVPAPRAVTVPAARAAAWSASVASVRAWSLCALHRPLAAGTTADGPLALDLARHRAFLRVHLEVDVAGRHLVRNLKALVGLAVAAGDGPDADRWAQALRRAAHRQVGPDGGHAERAPAAHCQVLADLIDVTGLLAAAGRPVPPDLTDAVTRMRGWLAAVRSPDGTVSPLDDGFPVAEPMVALLLADPAEAIPAARGSDGPVPVDTPVRGPVPATTGPAAGRTRSLARSAPASAALVLAAASPLATPPGVTPTSAARAPDAAEPTLRVLADSGLAVATAGVLWVLADFGPPSTAHPPAHASALAFLLWHAGRPLLVDTGTSTDVPGPVRGRERGTAAHSTIVVDGADSVEARGPLRAGRAARARLLEAGFDGAGVLLAGEHAGFHHLRGRPAHRRDLRLWPDRVEIIDTVEPTRPSPRRAGAHVIDVLFQFAPGLGLTAEPRLDRSGAGSVARFVRADGTIVTLRALCEPADAEGADAWAGPAAAAWQIVTAERATGWRRTVPAATARFRVRARLPLRVRTVLTVVPGASQPG